MNAYQKAAIWEGKAGGHEAAEAAKSFTGKENTSRSELQSRVKADDGIKGISVDEAQAIADEFIESYNGNIPLNIRVAATQEELYGPEGSGQSIGKLKGVYLPATKVFTLAANNLSSSEDARETIRHEILDHYGFSIFRFETNMILRTDCKLKQFTFDQTYLDRRCQGWNI